ncbi:Transcription initiation factor TFIID subunit 11 [Colletotrichum tanaceti]|uniref:Transcription initiation factor TFIID subunit 11 n=1 Tax=Colletotrichum tanaceti TaxID=1306861 RepID=A0A4U6XF44_9PEZI|nr:Transcription initiation factor TFIID subunit 11 [Colletotrichum tanaceti]TKW54480.1 Transcription initiation factor TFIID subunit 11 [Colletotrichum tanaceti]
MASPPYAYSPTALSPPYPSSAQLPMSNKKRASDGAPPGSAKRRKASTLSITSAAAHPLRQTSFPPEARSPFPRSPSADNLSVVSGSQVSGPPKKKRGRKPKNQINVEAREQTPSLVGGRAPTTVSGTGAGAEGQEDGANDEDDDNDMRMALVDSTVRTQEQKQEEIRLRAMLVESFDPEQYDRYEQWRAAKLTDAVVKRVVNATVSQSVPPNVALAVKSVSKLFIGELIERARDVQGEWIKATGEKQSEAPTPAPKDEASQSQAAKDDRRGPLRPDHLREAWRRYKMSGDGGWAGIQGLWHEQQQSGVERFPVRTGGRRVFR